MPLPLLRGSEDQVKSKMCCALETVKHHINVRNYYYGIKLTPMGKISANGTLSGGSFLSGRCFSARDASTVVCQWPALFGFLGSFETETLLSESSFPCILFH